MILHQFFLELGRLQLVDSSLFLQLRTLQLDVQHPQLELVLALGRLEDPRLSLHRFILIAGSRCRATAVVPVARRLVPDVAGFRRLKTKRPANRGTSSRAHAHRFGGKETWSTVVDAGRRHAVGVGNLMLDEIYGLVLGEIDSGTLRAREIIFQRSLRQLTVTVLVLAVAVDLDLNLLFRS